MRCAWIVVLLPFQLFAQQSLQLAPPLLQYSSGFDKGLSIVTVLFDQPGSEVHESHLVVWVGKKKRRAMRGVFRLRTEETGTAMRDVSV